MAQPNPVQKMAEVTCCACGLFFMVPEALEQNWREKHISFWCPNGHSLSFPQESNVEKLKKQVERLQKEKEWAQRESNLANEQAGKAEKALSLLRKRVKAGVCPCCKRTVSQMAEHMKNKHPEWKP